MLRIYEVLDNEYIDPELQRDSHKLLGEVSTRDEAHMLIGQFPGKGRCYIWNPETKRVVESLSWERAPRASN